MKKKTTKLVTYYCAVEKKAYDDNVFGSKSRCCSKFFKNKFLAMHLGDAVFVYTGYKIISHRFKE